MIRTQIYITEQEKKALMQMSRETGHSQSELIRHAINLLCESIKTTATNRLKLLRSAKGIWEDRDDSEFVSIRKGMDRF